MDSRSRRFSLPDKGDAASRVSTGGRTSVPPRPSARVRLLRGLNLRSVFPVWKQISCRRYYPSQSRHSFAGRKVLPGGWVMRETPLETLAVAFRLANRAPD